MRIGIDCRTILSENARYKAGVAHYTYYLVKYLLQTDSDNEYVLFFEGDTPSEIQDIAAKRGRVSIERWNFAAFKRFLPYVYSHLLLSRQVLAAHLDVFHAPANVVPLPLFKSKRRPRIVVTVHDLAIYHNPEWFTTGQSFSVRQVVPKTIKKADHIIAPSQATAGDLTGLFSVHENRISVIPLGVEERFFRPAPLTSPPGRPGHPYFLFLGTLEPRKNLPRLIRAYGSLPREITSRYDLILAGGQGWKYEDIFDAQNALTEGVKEGVKIVGYYPGQDLPSLLQGATAFVYPSLYEGFGLPILEALAGGCPVITSGGGALSEIAQESMVSVVDPESEPSLMEAMAKAIRDAATLAKNRQSRQDFVRQYSWERTARETLGVYQRTSLK
ncbi:MAG: Glycosyl transferase group 1 [Parcubacteria group bacterium GW2011_GWA2_51_12]|nr:MAG: Glycosyl transferase group 1 [Parcubacteria group bacterium GW2011_GWA2_51_12]